MGRRSGACGNGVSVRGGGIDRASKSLGQGGQAGARGIGSLDHIVLIRSPGPERRAFANQVRGARAGARYCGAGAAAARGDRGLRPPSAARLCPTRMTRIRPGQQPFSLSLPLSVSVSVSLSPCDARRHCAARPRRAAARRARAHAARPDAGSNPRNRAHAARGSDQAPSRRSRRGLAARPRLARPDWRSRPPPAPGPAR